MKKADAAVVVDIAVVDKAAVVAAVTAAAVAVVFSSFSPSTTSSLVETGTSLHCWIGSHYDEGMNRWMDGCHRHIVSMQGILRISHHIPGRRS